MHGETRRLDQDRAIHPGLDRIEAFFTGHAYDPHRHDTYAVGYTTSGVQSFNYRGARADSLPGNVLILHPDERHDGRAGTEGGFHYHMLYIEPRLVQSALGASAKTLPFVRGAVSANRRLRRALAWAIDEWARLWEAIESDQLVLDIAEALLTLDPSAWASRTQTICTTSVEGARQFIEDNHERTVASEELEALTTSPYRYLTMRRLDHARRAIQDGHSLADAAAASGFADQSHMTRQFRHAYGLSPGRWRDLSAPLSNSPA